MTAETLISGFPIACLFAGLLAVGAILALLAREFLMARLFALTLGAFLALLACCRIAELEKAGSPPSASTACQERAAGEAVPAPSVRRMAPEVGRPGEADGAGQEG